MIDDERINELYDAAMARANADPGLAHSLGVVMLTGFGFIARAEKFTGPQIVNTYHTHFPMPDGSEWEMTLKRRIA